LLEVVLLFVNSCRVSSVFVPLPLMAMPPLAEVNRCRSWFPLQENNPPIKRPLLPLMVPAVKEVPPAYLQGKETESVPVQLTFNPAMVNALSTVEERPGLSY